jgi:hypothetical protein
MEDLLWQWSFIIKENIVLIIATLALLVSLSETRQQRKHDQLSVHPTIEAICDMSIDRLEIYLKNLGLGPAKLLDFKIMLNNKEIDHSVFKMGEYLKNETNLPISIWERTVFILPSYIQINEKIDLFNSNIGIKQGDKEDLLNALDKISVKIIYETLYKIKISEKLEFAFPREQLSK